MYITTVNRGTSVDNFSLEKLNHLFSGEQCDGRDSVRILVAFCYGHLLKEIHLLLAGKEDYFGVTEHHDGVCELIAKQPRLRMMGGK